jgi:hypothetical protein
MRLTTLLGWSLAASLLAACSGGSGGVAPSGSGNAGAGNNGAMTQGLSLKINGPVDLGPTNVSRRSPKFIGTNVNTIAYTITPGPISGTFTETSPGVFSGCTAAGMPTVQTCDITLAPGTYALTVTLKENSTAVGSGNAGGILVTSGNVTSQAISINPVNSTPALSIPGSPTQFYNDGQAQTIALTENELDPISDIITTAYGPVGNYPVLTLTDSGGTTGVTLPASNPITNVPPSAVGGYTGEVLGYTGMAGNTTTLHVSLSDGTSTSAVSVPYVSIANNAAGSLTFSALGAPGAQTVTVTESTSAASGGLDSNFTSSDGGTCTGLATFSPALGSDPTSVAGPSASVTYTVTATSASTPSCTLNVASVNDPFLTTAITIHFPGTIGVGVGSHSRI